MGDCKMAGGKGKASKTVVWIILGLLIVGLGGFGATNFGGSLRSVGFVGDVEIDANDYARELERELRTLSERRGESFRLADALGFGIDRTAIERLISIAAIENETARIGLSAGDEVVANRILEIDSFHGLDGRFDREAYRFALRQAGLAERAYEDVVRSEIVRTLLLEAVGGELPPPTVYVDTMLAHLGETRTFSWIALDAEALEEPVEDPDDAEAREYYDANTGAYMRPETRKIAYAWLIPEMLVDTIEVDEEALRELYDERTDQYDRPERRLVERLAFATEERAAEARERLDSGEIDFEGLVAERGIDLADIDLGDVTEEDLGPAGPDVFAAEENGIVGPVETDLGPALVRVNAILEALFTSYEDARPELLDEFALDRARRDIADRVEDMDDLLAGGATLEELGEQTDMQFETIDWDVFNSEGIANYTAFRDAAQVVAVGDFPEILEFQHGGIFAIRLDEIVPSRLEEYDDVRDRVAQDWIVFETLDRLKDLAEEILTAVEGGAELDSFDQPVEQSEPMTRDGYLPDAPPTLLSTSYEMTPGELRALDDGASVYVLRLDEILPPDLEDPDVVERGDSLSEEAAREIGVDIQEAFIAALETQAGISLDQRAINAVHSAFP